MMLNRTLLTLALLLAPAVADAQNLLADRIGLKPGPCQIRAGASSPNGSVAGSPCDIYVDTSTEKMWWKLTGVGTNTGWITWDSTNTASYLMSRNASGDSALRNLLATSIYGNGGTGTNRLILGGTGGTCTTYPACEAATITFDTVLLQQRLATDLARGSQWYVTSAGARLNSYNGSGFAPLWIAAGPTIFHGGGVQVGTSTSSDPGLGNITLDGFVGPPGYVSQTSKWRIDNLGGADFRYLYTDELHAKSFIADLEQALAGGQIISKSVAIVASAFTVPAPGSISTLEVKDLPSASNMAVFQSGDYVRVRQFSRAAGSLSITDAWGTVTGYADLPSGTQTWQFTRLVTNGGAMSAGAVIEPDALVLDYGVSGNGFYEVNAIDGLYGINSPYAQVVTWAGDSPIAANQTLRVRVGNLRGVTGVTEYGMVAGTFAASNGQFFIATDQRFELHGIDLKLWNGSTNVIRMDRLTPYLSMGTPAPTSYSTGTGCWSGMDAGVFKWRCGDIAGGTQYIAWNGTQLQVAGNIVVTGTSIDASTVTGVAGATVVSGAQRALLGITSAGNPALPAVATPSGSGLFLGSDYMGFYGAGAWKTFMDQFGNFYLGGTSGALQWNAGAATLTISATLSGNGSGITSITGGNITTGSVTATQIAAGTITATQIAANTITAAKIAAGTITATEIAASTITGAKIAAGTITGTNIQAASISATELSVSSLSAISANLGTITAGSISGVTATFGGGSGDVTLNADGVTFEQGTGDGSSVKWSDGSRIYASSGGISVLGASGSALLGGGQGFIQISDGAGSGAITQQANTWYWRNVPGTSDADFPMVVQSAGSDNLIRSKTDGAHGTFCGGADFVNEITIERGIVVGVTCGTPAPGATRPAMLVKGAVR